MKRVPGITNFKRPLCQTFNNLTNLTTNLNKLKFLLRCVDDILAASNKEQDSLNFLNNRHPNIKFTIEKQINHSVALLYSF